MADKDTDDLDIPAFLKKDGQPPKEELVEKLAEAQAILDAAPVPEGMAFVADDRPVGDIVPPAPEGEGAADFRTADNDVLKDFPPEPPLVLPGVSAPNLGYGAALTQVDETPQPGNMRGSVFPHAPQEITQRIKSAPPTVVDTAPEEPPPAPRFEDLPERTRLELEAGRKIVGGRGPALDRAIEQSAAPPPQSNKPVEEPAPEREPSWDSLPERTRLELQAGAETLRRKNADYRAVQEQLKAADAKRLEENAPVQVGDLDYPAG